MSKAAEDRRNWLEQIKAEAEKQTLRRLEDADFDFHKEKEDQVNGVEADAKEAKTAKK